MICKSLGLPRATFYRLLKPAKQKKKRETKVNSPRSLTTTEKENISDILHELRFIDAAPAEIYSKLLDEGKYYCSISSFYRVLRELKEVQERRNILRHPNYDKPELLVTGPNQVWSWDITKLKGPRKGTIFYLYVILDIYSRFVVGWLIATSEKALIAKHLIEETCERQNVDTLTLTIHSDRGSSMTSKAVAELLSDLGVTKSLNRPHVSNDNPYSESQFKTLKYRPEFPVRFGSVEDARIFCGRFFSWYNNEHYHSGIALMTPYTVHYGKAEECYRNRQAVLQKAYEKNPERFVRGIPKPPQLPKAVWINPPDETTKDTGISITIINSDITNGVS